MQSCRSPLGSGRSESNRPRVSPPPAALQEGALEAAVNAHGYYGWNVPGWEERALQTATT
jgi:hypothetical protein